jgi:lipopolysaccharide export system permease protein
VLTIIDRYILKSFLAYFFAGLIVFLTIFMAIEFISTGTKFDVTTAILIEYYKNYLPIVLHQMMPIGIMIGALFTLSVMNRNNELISLFSLGWSLARISAPILALIGLLCVVTFWLGDRLVPTFAQKRNYVYYVEMRKKPGLYSTVRDNKIWYRSDNTIFNIQSLNEQNGVAQGITLYYFDEAWNLQQLIRAKKVNMTGRLWNLEDGTVTLFADEVSYPLTKSFSIKALTIGEDFEDFQAASPKSDALSFQELKTFITKNKEAGLDTLSYEVDLHGKLAFSFAGLILALMGIPFTVERSRSGGNMLNIGLSVGFAFMYWVLYSFSLNLGKSGVLYPVVAAWGPNLLLGGISAILLFRLRK